MTRKRMSKLEKIDALLGESRSALDASDAFKGERSALEAVLKSHDAQDYTRMGKGVELLRESRRAKREAALDAGFAGIIDAEVPESGPVDPGYYLVRPPRVGVDGRALGEVADQSGNPVVVVVREPTTRDGRCPIVTIGPVTIRSKIGLPEDEDAPSPDWVMDAVDELSEAAIEEMDQESRAIQRMDGLLDRVLAHPDGDSLHEALVEACTHAAAFEEEARAKAAAKASAKAASAEDDADDE